MTEWKDSAAIRLYLEETSESDVQKNHQDPFWEDL